MDWDVVGSAAAYAQFAGLMAGVAFVALTLILTRDVPATVDNRRSLAHVSIGDFLLAFVTLSLCALAWTVLGGNPETRSSLLTTRVAATSANVLLAVGGLQMVCGVCHLVMDFEVREDAVEMGSLQRVARLTYGFVAGAGSFLAVNDLLRLMLLGFWDDTDLLLAISLLSFAVGAAVTFASSRPRGAWVRTIGPAALQVTPGGHRRRVLTVGLGVTCLVLFVAMMGQERGPLAHAGQWAWEPEAILTTIVLSGAVASALVLFVIQGWSLQDRKTLLPEIHSSTHQPDAA